MDNKIIQITVFIFILVLVLNILSYYYKKQKHNDNVQKKDSNFNYKDASDIFVRTVIYTIIIAGVLLLFILTALLFSKGYIKGQ